MAEEVQSTARAAPEQPARSREAEEERKERVLTQGKPSVTRSIADAVVIKDGNLFFLSEPDAQIPLDRRHGFGLYYHDCRYLNGYDLRLAGVAPNLLVSSAAQGFMAVFEFSNPDIRMEGGVIPAQDVGIKWQRVADGSAPALHDRISFHNYGLQAVELPVSLTFRAEFEDVFVVRGLLSQRPGELHPPEWHGEMLRFLYAGADGLYRSTTVRLAPGPDRTEGTTAHLRVVLGPGEAKQLVVSVLVAESERRQQAGRELHARPDFRKLRKSLQRASDRAMERKTTARTDSILLNRILRRSFRDLHMLRSQREGKSYFSAGLPWFGTLFGRDTIITALEMLPYAPGIAAETLRVLAAYQGTETDDWRDEQPGKILHELRVGEFARMGEIPHTPYYGTVDATPLFLVLLGRYTAWTGDLDLFHELRGNVERALEWARAYGDLNDDGYIEYRSESRKGLVNQGWKDSGDAIVNADGSLAEPPIALVEVQAYLYMAKRLMAGLYRRAGEPERGDRLDEEAAVLQRRFNRDFWLEREGIYALALQAAGRPATVVSSNPGHALWTGIADQEKARRTMERLLARDMFSGWGVRTLSTRETRYNPIGYHLGTVWPHDNALIAAGFRRYGFDHEALRIFDGIVRAVANFEHYRLPELFAGFGRDEFRIPVRYPVACHPQAWAAGSIPYLLETLLGLVPDAFERRLRIVRPLLPDFVDRIRVEGLAVADARVDLRFERARHGVNVQVLGLQGELEVVIEPATAETSGEAAP